MAGEEKHTQHNTLGEVRACKCGGVSLAMGPMTLHFEADEVQDLFDLACAAKGIIDGTAQPPARTPKRRGKPKAHGTIH